nr:hypothetical protein [uncultured Tolumonas sp.]
MIILKNINDIDGHQAEDIVLKQFGVILLAILRKVVEETMIPLEDGFQLHITLSTGVTTLMNNSSNIDILFEQTDKALYKAKYDWS